MLQETLNNKFHITGLEEHSNALLRGKVQQQLPVEIRKQEKDFNI